MSESVPRAQASYCWHVLQCFAIPLICYSAVPLDIEFPAKKFFGSMDEKTINLRKVSLRCHSPRPLAHCLPPRAVLVWAARGFSARLCPPAPVCASAELGVLRA